MKLSDYVAKFLARQGIKHVFGLTGGAVVHLFDSLVKTPGITPIFTHHEQAAALAAQAYGRIRNDLGACLVTTGPGGTNALTGVLAAWMDSIPCLFLSGQSRIQHTSHGKPVRQIGSQEFDIVSLVSNITKYSVMVDDPKKIRYYLEKAVHTAKTGRPGPVWVDIPLNFQWEMIDENNLIAFDPKEGERKRVLNPEKNDIQKCLRMLSQAKKPVVLAGYGIRLAHAEKELEEFIRKTGIPFVTSWNAGDLLPSNHPLNNGRLGLIGGQKGANITTQNCDLILALGSHMCLTLTGQNNENIAASAKKIAVDIDPVETDFKKDFLDLAVNADVKEFLEAANGMLEKEEIEGLSSWRKSCQEFKKSNEIPQAWKNQKSYVNPYVFLDVLSGVFSSKDVIVVDGGGTALYTPFQAVRLKKGQRMIVSSGISSMGTGLAESVGACFSSGKRRTICIIGDGSMQFNVQELQTIRQHRLPVKIFVYNNGGYLAIRHTQDAFLDKKYIGSSEKGGVSLPDFTKVAKAYGIKTARIGNHRNLADKIKSVLEQNGPVLCELMISPDQQMKETS